MRYCLFLLILGLSACNETPKPQEPRPEMLAKSLCNSTHALLELNRQAASDGDSLSFRKIATEFEKARQSALALKVKPDERAALSESLKKLCPDLAKEEALLEELLAQ